MDARGGVSSPATPSCSSPLGRSHTKTGRCARCQKVVALLGGSRYWKVGVGEWCVRRGVLGYVWPSVRGNSCNIA